MSSIWKLLSAVLLLGFLAESIFFLFFSKSNFSLKRWASLDSTENIQSMYEIFKGLRGSDATRPANGERTFVNDPLQMEDRDTSYYFREVMSKESDFDAWVESSQKFLELLDAVASASSRNNFPNESSIVDTNRLSRPDAARNIMKAQRRSNRVPLGSLNPLEEYFVKVNSGKQDIRNGPVVGPKEFGYVLNPGTAICSDVEVFLFAFVPTAVEHYEYRQTIRRTWGRTNEYKLPVRRLFFLGRSASRNSVRLQETLDAESHLFGDIVQEDFLDTYDNLTYKSLSGFRWATKYCSQATYVLKIDDDTFVNMFALVDTLQRSSNPSQRPVHHPFFPVQTVSPASKLAIFGRVVYHDEVHRTGKWAVDEIEFRFPVFPTYCSGPAYVVTMSLAKSIVSDSLFVPFFRLEDLFVTGFVNLLQGRNVTFVQLQDSYAFSDRFPSAFLGPVYNYFLFAIQVDDNRLFRNVWNYLRRKYTEVKTTSSAAFSRRVT